LYSENRNEKASRGSSYRQIISQKGSGLGLVPLDPVSADSEEEEEIEEEDDLEARMRDAKIHQEILRTQYTTTVK